MLIVRFLDLENIGIILFSIALIFAGSRGSYVTLLHSDWPKLNGVLAILSAIGLNMKQQSYFQTSSKE